MKKTRKMRRTFSQNVLVAWFNKRKAKAINATQDQAKTKPEAKDKPKANTKANTKPKPKAKDKTEKTAYAKAMAKVKGRLKTESEARTKAEQRLKAEIEARAMAEQKVKAETEKMLSTQYRRHSVLAERIEIKAKNAIAAAKTETEKKVRSYEAMLVQTEEKLSKTQKKAKAEAIARAEAEENLKAESEERQRVEAQAVKAIAAAKVEAEEAEEKVQSYSAALTQAEEKLSKAKEKAKTEALTGAKVEESLKAESEERHNVEAQAAEVIKTFKRIRQYVFPPGAIKRKFAFISALVILSAIVFAVSIVNDPPVAIGDATTTLEDTPVLITLMGTDTDGEQLTYNVVAGPSHGSLSGTAPTIAYTPALNYNGPDSFTFRVNDGKADSDQVMIPITVLAVNDAPIANPHSVSTAEDTPVAISLMGSDPEEDPLAYSTVTGPSHGSLNGTAPNLTYMPNTNFNGSDSFTFKVNDGTADSVLATVSITVFPVNDPPVAEPGSATTQEETPVPIILMGTDPDGEQLTYNVVTAPSHGSLSGTAPSMTYTSALNYNGPDSFTFRVNDGKADSDPVMIPITVLAVNDAPIANPQSEMTKVNKSVSATLTGSDVDGDPLMFIICTEPEHGTLTFDSNFNTGGRLIYTPEPYFTGPDIFIFKLHDGATDSAPATVSINVAPNHFPVAEPHSVTTTEDTPVAISLMGSDPDEDPLAYSTVTGPSHGSLNGTAPNLTYTPDTNFNGSDSFTFKVNDGTADSVLATVSITVSPVNDPPVANGDATTTQEDTPVVMIDVLANDIDIDNDTLTVTTVSQGSNGSVTINPDSTLAYSPHANFYGSDAFTYTISDDKGQTDTASVNVMVNMVNDAPVTTSTPVTTATAGALYTYDVDAADPDVGDTLTYSLTTKPADMTIDSATGLIQWKPTNAQVGANEVVVKVADSNSIPALDTQSFTITVNPAPPRIAKLTVLDGYNQRNKKTLSADGKTNIVQSSDNNRLGTSFGSYVSYDFSDVSIPADAAIKSVVVRVEHFEEERFAQGKLEWAIGTGWPTKPVVWASINAPVHEGQSNEAVDSWDVTNIVDTREKIKSLQLQIKNNNNVTNRKTLTDYIYVVVEWD